MSDEETKVVELRALVRDFVTEREWGRYHTPKNLSMALAVEVAELMEHFQWWNEEELEQKFSESGEREAIGAEIADVASYLLSLVNAMGFDLSSLMFDKMQKNAQKYPVEDCRGDYQRPT